MAYYIIYAIVVFAGLAMMVREGLWSNTITLVNILISGLVAFGFYSPLVVYLDEDVTSGQHTYWLDFAIIWGLFSATMLVCRTLTAQLSKTRMRFKHPIDPVGGPIMGFVAAWVLAAFTLATLHTSPMPKDAFGGKLVYTDADSAFLLTSPDAAWLRFVAAMSDSNAYGSSSTDKITAQGFVNIYGQHREKFEKSPAFLPKRG
jgi:uncharacterized membrane protein required for colicin V production